MIALSLLLTFRADTNRARERNRHVSGNRRLGLEPISSANVRALRPNRKRLAMT